MILGNRQGTYIDETKAANYLSEHVQDYDGLSRGEVINAHKDPAFLNSLEISGYGAVHMADSAAQQERLYVSMCHRHYTNMGKAEVISAQHRHALWVQKEANRRLGEHGSYMYEEGKDIGYVGGYMSGHGKGLEAGKATVKKPWIDFGGDFAGGFVDTFRWIGVVGVVLILAVVYMAYGKGKG
jgi:hypothetical protein